ncbi:EscS/YscS/HrcS family type III secretion system export apparatus protein [Salinicola corii]|uniref:EscS/YscS/HrcS family type III secretion system export apparatus protein n=1 Tax=Salinicola corii TaxID=2606937 RepID=A0A640WEB3_9GAMM|nr:MULTISPECIES: type III secretion system export apparatus subunit SctS [Salinicola]KAA0018279.1 EscS/YscS/HrcS family type III secretion system export apparatus protein [Salinicola corii]MAM57707.1 EscS/YscS/HrcS family type III secretion system export apparatus protein [Salinicola sp.]NRB55143.1 type III secretion system export apparatus subunit SctS [Salinicola sp.]|tara:strand:- start:1698 stop:1967 length:270 start_codon:yes stop_codon:yes gene_type:complete
MTDDIFLSLMKNALWTVLLVSAPALLVAIAVGFGVGLLQALTQIQDQTLPQAVKLVAVLLVLILSGPLLAGQIVNITDQVLDNFAAWSR